MVGAGQGDTILKLYNSTDGIQNINDILSHIIVIYQNFGKMYLILSRLFIVPLIIESYIGG